MLQYILILPDSWFPYSIILEQKPYSTWSDRNGGTFNHPNSGTKNTLFARFSSQRATVTVHLNDLYVMQHVSRDPYRSLYYQASGTLPIPPMHRSRRHSTALPVKCYICNDWHILLSVVLINWLASQTQMPGQLTHCSVLFETLKRMWRSRTM